MSKDSTWVIYLGSSAIVNSNREAMSCNRDRGDRAVVYRGSRSIVVVASRQSCIVTVVYRGIVASCVVASWQS